MGGIRQLIQLAEHFELYILFELMNEHRIVQNPFLIEYAYSFRYEVQ